MRASVLNVPGGQLAQFAGSTSSLAAPFLTSFATSAGIPAQTCGGVALAAGCSTDLDCAPEESCSFNEDFVALLEAALPGFQHQMDPGDGINYARAFRIDPEGDPKAVLIQEGIGDTVVANPLTEALARGIGLAPNRADSAAEGVGAFWRFPPPQGHGIFGLAEVRAQAITFLETGGTTLQSP